MLKKLKKILFLCGIIFIGVFNVGCTFKWGKDSSNNSRVDKRSNVKVYKVKTRMYSGVKGW